MSSMIVPKKIPRHMNLQEKLIIRRYDLSESFFLGSLEAPEFLSI
jgi:hypothetical protein